MNGPEIIARFKLDENGKPIFHSGSGLRHYEITLHTAAPPETESVTYRLHHSYFDPIREVMKAQREDFAEAITSYGDYEIEVATSGFRQRLPLKTQALLTSALRKGHRDQAGNPTILEAIHYLENH